MQALMLDENVKPVQRITYNSNNYQRFDNDDDDENQDDYGDVLKSVNSITANNQSAAAQYADLQQTRPGVP